MKKRNRTPSNIPHPEDLNTPLTKRNFAAVAAAPLSLLGEYEVLKNINEALAQLFAHQTAQEALEAAFRIICEATGCDGIMLFRYAQVQPDKVEAETVFELRWLEEAWRVLPNRVIRFPLEEEQVRERLDAMLHRGTTTVVFNRQVPPKLRKLLTDLDINAYISFRIVVDGAPFGGMSLLSRQPVIAHAQAYGKLLVSFAQSVGSFLARKEAEEKIMAQRDYFRQIIDVSPLPTFVKNRQGEYTLLNQAMTAGIGLQPEELLGKPVTSFMRSKKEAAMVLAEDAEMLRTKQPKLSYYKTLTAPNDEKHYVQVYKAPLLDNNNEVYEIITVLDDITPLKKIEQKLVQEKIFKEQITATMPDPVLIFNLPEKIITYHTIKTTILGFDINKIGNLYHFLMNALHPDDAHLVERGILQISTARREQVLSETFRLKHQLGYWVYYYTRFKIFSLDDMGRVKECLVLMQDVTELKKAEIALQHSENILKATLNALPDLKFRLRKDGTYLDFYQSEYENIQPYAPRSVIMGKTLRDVMPPHLAALFTKNVQDAVAQRQVQVQEYEIDIPGQGHQYREARFSPINAKEVICVVRDISERKRAEKALKTSQERYSNFIKYSQDGIYFMNCGIPISIHLHHDELTDLFYKNAYIEECNEAMARMYGTTVEQLRGTPALALHGGEHFEVNRQSFKNLISNGFKVSHAETIEPDVKGNFKYFLNNAVGVIEKDHLLGFWGTQIDITARKEAESRLQESRTLLKAIVNALPDLKFRMNKNGSFLDYYESEYENDPPLMPPSEFIGKTLYDILPSFIADVGLQSIQNALRYGRIETFEYFLPMSDEPSYFEGRTSPVGTDEVIIAVRNISDRKKAQLALQEKLRELDEKNKELTQYIESNVQLENFAYIASHDLREPVRTVHSFAQLLKKRYAALLDEDGRRCLDFIIYGSENMNRLIEDLLTYSRVSSEEHKVETLETAPLLAAITAGLTQFIREQNATILLRELPTYITANPITIQQLLQNLLVNAIKFQHSERPPVIQLSGIDYGEHWLFEVKDNGIGIPGDMQERIFQLFKKIHYTPAHQGTGMGLAICKRIVEQHGGEIWVESVPGEGSSFYFTLKKD
jgi:PAS domain S-box-containing protein